MAEVHEHDDKLKELDYWRGSVIGVCRNVCFSLHCWLVLLWRELVAMVVLAMVVLLVLDLREELD